MECQVAEGNLTSCTHSATFFRRSIRTCTFITAYAESGQLVFEFPPAILPESYTNTGPRAERSLQDECSGASQQPDRPGAEKVRAAPSHHIPLRSELRAREDRQLGAWILEKGWDS